MDRNNVLMGSVQQCLSEALSTTQAVHPAPNTSYGEAKGTGNAHTKACPTPVLPEVTQGPRATAHDGRVVQQPAAATAKQACSAAEDEERCRKCDRGADGGAEQARMSDTSEQSAGADTTTAPALLEIGHTEPACSASGVVSSTVGVRARSTQSSASPSSSQLSNEQDSARQAGRASAQADDSLHAIHSSHADAAASEVSAVQRQRQARAAEWRQQEEEREARRRQLDRCANPTAQISGGQGRRLRGCTHVDRLHSLWPLETASQCIVLCRWCCHTESESAKLVCT